MVYGETNTANKTIEFLAEQTGDTEIVVSKTGYSGAKASIKIDMDLTIYLIAFILAIIISIGIWFKFLRKKTTPQ